jgi:UDPglucose 6-dehydrogenase
MKKIAVIGSGVVGQATGKGLINIGHNVVFCDINPRTLAKLEKEAYQTCDPHSLGDEEKDFYFLTVSTPTSDNKIELNFLESAVANLGSVIKNQKRYCLVIVRSTVPPGTTEDNLIPILEKYSGKKAGKDFGVCMNPEYLREISNEDDFKNPWIITIGELDNKSGEMLEKIYSHYKCPVHRVSLREAEMQKYVHNLFNACKISFFNEMRTICNMTGINADKVFDLVIGSAEAMWSPRYGTKNLGPYGGSCLPKDTTALLSWVKENLDIQMPLLQATIKVNEGLQDNSGKQKRHSGK